MLERLEQCARELEQSGEYRVLRRLTFQDDYVERGEREVFVGIILDTETTGLDVQQADVIELGMIKFEYTLDGDVVRVIETFNQMQQPSGPIPPKITLVTGITDAMVAGQSIDADAVEAVLSGVSVVIAHNARFDRPMCEKTWPIFEGLNWACSWDQVPWREAGFDGGRLGYLLNDYGYFHNGHRASDDCRALLHLLAAPFPLTDRPALAILLERARATTIRLWAEGAPYEQKDVLKARGYRWSDGANNTRRAWWKDIPEDSLEEELAYLTADVFRRAALNLPQQRITARERYSLRFG